MPRAHAAVRPLMGLLLLLGVGCGAERPFNLLLISLDTTAASRMSVYGAERETTPAITALARGGVLFENAYSPSPWTLPAHASMLTGRYPSSLAPDPNDLRLYLVAPLLSQLFQQKGHATGAVTGGVYVASSLGADRGFDSFERAGVQRAIRWLEAHQREPFFFFFHTYTAHIPYMSRQFAGGREAGRLAEIYRGGDLELHKQVCCLGMQLTPAEREYLLALYDGGIAAADRMVGQLVSALTRLDILDRTLIVVTSDHGEEFWQHTGRAAYHGHTLYQELLRVPLLWVDPALAGPGRTLDQAVSLIDLVPTFIARFDLPRPARLDGVDLGPLLEGRDWGVERPLFAEAVRHGPARMSIRTREGVLIEAPDPDQQQGEGSWAPLLGVPTRQLFLSDDPEQQRDASDSHPELAARLAEQLAAHRRNATPDEPPMPAVRPSAAEREALKALGYLE